MKKEYSKPVAMQVKFNYEKVMAASCTQGGWDGDYGWFESNCEISIEGHIVQSKTRNSCLQGSGGSPLN